jgi:hypothetical protein
MTTGAEVKDDQAVNQDRATAKADKAKPVAVDQKAKELAQTGKLAPEERMTAIKELLSNNM